jgi:hypothetical protein
MNPLDEVLTAINGFYVRYGVRPEYAFNPQDVSEAHHVHIVDEQDSSRAKWSAQGASIDEALAKLADEMTNTTA